MYRRLLSSLLFLALGTPALAQLAPQAQVPTQTVVGRLTAGTGGVESIPFSKLSAHLFTGVLSATQIASLNFTTQATPSSPAAGTVLIYGDSTLDQILALDSSGNKYRMLNLTGTAPRSITMDRSASGNGQGLTLYAGGGVSGGTNVNGGDLKLQAGTSTGTGTSAIRLYVSTANLTPGTTDNGVIEAMRVDNKGHVGFTGAITGAVSCGTSPVVTVGSTDNAGEVTTGSTATTSCQLNFQYNGYTVAPNCSVTPVGAAVTSFYTVVTTTTMVLHYGSATSQKFQWVCHGN